MLRFPRQILTCLLSLVCLGGCVSQRPSVDEVFDRQLIFTVSEDRSPFGSNDFTSSNMSELDHSVSNIIKLHKLKKVAQWSIKVLGLEAIVAEFRGERNIEDVLNALKEDLRIESVQTVKVYRPLTYNDPYFYLQNSVDRDDLEKIHGLATGKNVVVGVVDTGVDRTHPELAGRIIYSANFVSYDQYDFDNDEHGTTVAGVIASAANNEVGIVGVAPDVKLKIFKSCAQNDQTRRAYCDSFSLMKALVDVLKQRPDIVNLSLAGPTDPLLVRLIQAVLADGIIVVAAVDSQNPNNTFPASIPGVIAVDSPRESVFTGMPKNGVLAPGLEVLTTTPGATYAFRSGSSMSSAYVSGVAALLKERQPTLSAAQLIEQLHASAQGLFEAVPLVDLCRAVSRMGDTVVCTRAAVAVFQDR